MASLWFSAFSVTLLKQISASGLSEEHPLAYHLTSSSSVLNLYPDWGLHSICQQIWKTQPWPKDWERSVFIPISKKGDAKECSNYCTIALISHASKVMLKILQVRLQQYVNQELPDVQEGLWKGRGNRDQIANILWNMDKAREFQKNIYFCFIDYAKAFVWITIKCGNS